jgi:prevent-host-death family protein
MVCEVAMKSFSVSEAKRQWSKVLDLVEGGVEVIITRHGKAVGQLATPKATFRNIVEGDFVDG